MGDDRDLAATTDATRRSRDCAIRHIELRLTDVEERQRRYRALRDADRSALAPTRTLRHSIGRTMIRLGTRIGGDPATARAWQG